MNRRRLASLLGHRAARDELTRGARDAARRLRADLWLVGGYVRDAALGRRATDVDLIAGRGVRGLIDDLRERWGTRGFRFRKRGVTTWRFHVAGRTADVVDASRRGLERDLARRDFTINAVAYALDDGAIVDPLGGLDDLRRRRLRLPRPDAIRADPLRALRGARFVAQLPEFALDREAAAQASRAGRGLARAAAERVRDELDKLLGADEPRCGLETLVELGLIDAVLPWVAAQQECRAGGGRPDVWRHTLDALDHSRRGRRLPGARCLQDPDSRRLLRWALLLHDISKPETFAVREDGRPTFHGHEILGADRASDVLEALRMPRDERKRIVRLIRNHLRPGHLADAGPTSRGLRRLVHDAGGDLPLLVVHAACDALGSGSPDAAARWRRLRHVLRELLERWETGRTGPLPRLIDGRDVMRVAGITPGPGVGGVLERARELQEGGKLGTREQALAWLRRLRRRG